jgi:hypothetical protein
MLPPSLCSPPRNCSHQVLPFVEAAAKAKLAGGIETQPSDHFAALSAFCIVDGPIMTARNKNVRREWVVFCFHCHKLGLDITDRRRESFQCVLKACSPACCSIEHPGCGASSGEDEARKRTCPFVPPDARPSLQAQAPRGKETRPSQARPSTKSPSRQSKPTRLVRSPSRFD